MRRAMGRWIGEWAWLALPLAVGVFLRVVHLRWQVLADDEWHAFRSAVYESYSQLFLGFSASVVPPLTLFYKALYDTVGLSEKAMRLPMLAASVACIAALPALLPAGVGLRARQAFAWLLAISPILVHYARYARPYAISLLFAGIALLVFYRWWQRETTWGPSVFVPCAVFAGYLHLTFVPALLAPFAFGLADAWWRRGESGRSWRELIAPAVLIFGPLGILLGLPTFLDWGAITLRAGESSVELATLIESLPLIYGSGRWPVVLALTAAAVVGAWRLWRQQPRLLAYLALVCGASVAATTLSKALAIGGPIVFLRYTFVLLPAGLLLAALAIGWALETIPPAATQPAVVAVAALLFWLGPLPAITLPVNSWTNHGMYQYTYVEGSQFAYRPVLVPKRTSAFYRRLAAEKPGSLLIAEAPYWVGWPNNPLAHYQEGHRQWTKVGFLGEGCQVKDALTVPFGRPGAVHFRNAVLLTKPAGVGLHGIDYVVFHKNLRKEFPGRADGVRAPTPDIEPMTPEAFTRCVRSLADALGQPGFEDQDLLVWDVRAQKTQTWTEGAGFDLRDLTPQPFP